MVIVFEGQPCRIIDFRHHTPGNLRAMVQAKLKNVKTGAGFEHRFRADDSVERASMETHDLEFLYQGGDTYHFMNVENYDQLEMDTEALGDNAQWMVPNMRIQAEFYDGRPIGITLPQALNVPVTFCSANRIMNSARSRESMTCVGSLGESGESTSPPRSMRTGQ